MNISAAQCRAARALLDWSQDDLATNAQVARATVADFERNLRSPMRQNLLSMTSAFEAAGVAFIGDDEAGAGVRFRKVELEYSRTVKPLDGGENIGMPVQYRGVRYVAVIPRELIDDLDRAHFRTFEERAEAVGRHQALYLVAIENLLSAGREFADNRIVLRASDLPA